MKQCMLLVTSLFYDSRELLFKVQRRAGFSGFGAAFKHLITLLEQVLVIFL